MRERAEILAACVLSALAAAPAQVLAQAAPGVADPRSDLAEVIVTATKRDERLVEVPLSISVLDANSMASQNLVNVQDYVARVPGLSVNSTQGGRVSIAIRGITTGGLTNSTVGVTLDDVPVSGSTGTSYGPTLVPELDPSTIRQLEVLRGPQGTLYGASTLGGLLRYVSTDPDPAARWGRVAVGLSTVARGEEGYNVRGSVNVPVGESAAILANGFMRRDPGYVDDSSRGLSDVNRVDLWGGRVALLWRPSERVTARLSALLQKVEGDGSAQIDTNNQFVTPVPYNQTRLPGTGPFDRTMQLYTGSVTVNLGGSTLTAVSGYSISDYREVSDTSIGGGINPLARAVTGRADAVTIADFSVKTWKFSQEVRLASQGDSRLEWLVAGFFTDEHNNPFYHGIAVQRVTGTLIGSVLPDRYPSDFSEWAGFATLTYHFTDRFDLQLGGRYGKNKQLFQETIDSPPYPEVYNVEGRSSEDVFTYSITPRFRINPDMTLYARIASGYRPGGPNPGAGFGLPASYSSDETVNYEIGYKADLFDRALSLDAAVYWIKWTGIQLQQTDPATSFVYYANASEARSRGFEASITGRPTASLTITGTVGYTDAELTQDAPLIAGSPRAGARLPYSAPRSASLAVDQQFALSSTLEASIGGTVAYLGDRRGVFARTGQVEYPAYTTVDLRAALTRGTWRASLFVTNLTDKFAPVSGGERAARSPLWQAVINRPRTIGVELSTNF
jgi:iron complex outermembrane receptor protein